MIDEDTITVSIPYYGRDFTMPWNEYRDHTVAAFIDAAARRVVEGSTYARLFVRPAFALHVPGRDVASSDDLLSSVANAGGFVLLLTPPNRQPQDLTASGPPPTDPTQLQVALDQILTRYRTSLTAPVRRQYPPLLQGHVEEDDSDDADEEYVNPGETLATGSGIARTLQFVHNMLGVTGVPAGGTVGITSSVKKVLNIDTFNRVCPVVTSEEIASETTVGTIASIEDADAVGGSQDAGLGACSVCLSLLVDRTKTPGELRRMPNCIHKFHTECLSEWLTHNAITCPVCREPAVTDPKDYGYLGYGSQENVYTPATAIAERNPAPRPLPDWLPVFPQPHR